MIALVAVRLASLALFLVSIAVTEPVFPALALVNGVAADLVFLASFLVVVVVRELVFLALIPWYSKQVLNVQDFRTERNQ